MDKVFLVTVWAVDCGMWDIYCEALRDLVGRCINGFYRSVESLYIAVSWEKVDMQADQEGHNGLSKKWNLEHWRSCQTNYGVCVCWRSSGIIHQCWALQKKPAFLLKVKVKEWEFLYFDLLDSKVNCKWWSGKEYGKVWFWKGGRKPKTLRFTSIKMWHRFGGKGEKWIY